MIARPLYVLAWVALTLVAPSAHAAPSPWDAFVEHASANHADAGRTAAEFLRDNRPLRDADLDPAILEHNLEYALRARNEFPWARAVPDAMFLNDVLPYAVLDETREDWRPPMYARCREIVQGCETATDAIRSLNRDVFKLVNVHYNTDRERPNQSPAESIRQSKASCSGLSILLVDACRSVGIPARVAGVASWHDKRGNHTWVEAWDGSQWRFMGADEYDPNGLDRGWFTADAAQAVPGDETFGVWASSWRRADRYFPLVWDPDTRDVPGVDVTDRYIPAGARATDASAAVRHLRAWDGPGRIAADVRLIDATGKVIATARTRAGTADLNDMPDVTLEPGARYTLELDHAGRTYVMSLAPADAGTETLDLHPETMERALTRDEAAAALGDAWRDTADRLRAQRDTHAADEVVWGDFTMRYLERTFGDAPEHGHSLWISLHGGGNAPAEVNDQQWHNQIKLYELDEGIYVAPRAPTDTWNLWHQGHIDHLLDALIGEFVATRGVDPDRVYLLGYSAGGDGVYQLAPRMADRFAAASMMAGHPNEAQPFGLRNLPFAIFVGGKDDAYDRNKVARSWGALLDQLQRHDPHGYAHRLTVYPECGHWMNGQDREAIPWMASKTRDPWPDRVVWSQDDVTHTRFYWLEVAPEDAKQGLSITAEVFDQKILISAPGLREITLHLSDELLDLDRPISVFINGQPAFEGTVRRTSDAIVRSLTSRPDPRLASCAQLTIRW
ncbi:MAG: transglutaminase domain-containing protein [Phycisphaerales bacterium]